MADIRLKSYAKVNLTLEVLERRPDGYHNINSVAQVVDLSDEIAISTADAGVIELDISDKSLPRDSRNLAYAACREFFEATAIAGGARIRIDKHIPVQAGLGGGSGNAAAVIVGLDKLFGTRLSVDAMAFVASRVSSDAAMFILGGTVRMRGRGENVEPLPDIPRLNLLIVKPWVGVSTGWAYEALDKRGRATIIGASNRMEAAIKFGDKRAVIEALANDFESVVLERFPDIREIKARLIDFGAEAALLAGSGSAVFGVFEKPEVASKAASSFGSDSATYVVTTLTRRESAWRDL
jgi:4-diphosphocytidyl-2-C-methyl-D-erythritol kinase